MVDSRHEHDLADAVVQSDDEARHIQEADAARIHQEVAEADRIATDIDDLLAGN